MGPQGPTGPQGPQGPQGNQGPQGPQGPNAGITSYTNPADNRVITSVSSTTINAEANLQFDGTNLGIGGAGSYPLDVIQTGGGTGTASAALFRAGNNSDYFGNNQILLGYSATSDYKHVIKTRHNSANGSGNAIDFYLWQNGQTAAAIGSLQAMTIENNAGSVRIGIATSAAAYTLDVNGNIRSRGDFYVGFGTSSDVVMYINSQNGSQSQIRSNTGVSSSYNGIMISSNYNAANSLPSWSIDLGGAGNSTTNTNAFTVGYRPYGGSWASYLIINSSGNVGINTTPAGKLDISGGSYNTGLIVRSSSTGGTGAALLNTDTGGHDWYIISTATGNGGGAGNLGFYDNTNGSYLFYIKGSNGNVGIGSNTTNPAYKLEVITTGTLGYRLQTSSSTVGNPQIDLYDLGRVQETVISSTDGTTTGTYIASYSNHPLLFGAYAGSSSTAKMIITASGYVGIGTVSPSAYPLTVDGAGSTSIRVRYGSQTRYRSDWGVDSSGNIFMNAYYDTSGFYRPFNITASSMLLTTSVTVTCSIGASNFSGSSSGTNTGDQTNISGNAGTVSGITAVQFFNNMGQGHGTQTDFNSISNFGFRYVQGSTNGPGTGSSQFYGVTLGLGDDYSFASYALQLAIPRYLSTDSYISMRNREGGSWSSWFKVKAGYADSAGSASSATTAGTVTHYASRTDGTYYNAVWAAGNPSYMYSCDSVQIQSSTGTLKATNLFSTSTLTANGSTTLLNGNDTSQISRSFGISGADYKHKYILLARVPTYGNITVNCSFQGKFTMARVNELGMTLDQDIALYIGYGNSVYYNTLALSGNTCSLVSYNYGGTNYLALYIYTAPNYFEGTFTGMLTNVGGWLDGNFLTVVELASANHSAASYNPMTATILQNPVVTSANIGSYETSTLSAVTTRGNTTGSNIITSASMYAGVYYDYYDNGYYTQPRGISRVYGVAIRGEVSGGDTSNQIFFWGNGNTTTSSIGFKQVAANSAVFPSTGYGDGYNTYFTMDTGGRGWVFQYNPGSWATSVIGAFITNSGIIWAKSDIIAYSDARVKENVHTIENALHKVVSSRGVTYDRIDSGIKNNIGFIAQELEEYLPELVTTDDNGLKSVKYQNMTAVLVEAIKELKAEVDDLRSRLDR
jgi:hypothetical protein